MTDKLDQATISAQYTQAKNDLKTALAARDTAQQQLTDATATVQKSEKAVAALKALYQSLFGKDPA